MEYEKQYDEFVQEFAAYMNKATSEKEISDLVFLCVGTDRITGDSFGPLVGHKLKRLYKAEKKVHIYGDLELPLSADNIEKNVQRIQKRYERPFVIAIDSAVSEKSNIGKIVTSKRRMHLGSSLSKEVIKVGDISIKGIVSEDLGSPQKNFILLQNTSLGLVMNMADITAKGIYEVIRI